MIKVFSQPVSTTGRTSSQPALANMQDHARICKNYIRMTSAAVQQDTKGLDLFLGFPRSGNAKVQSWQSQGPLSEPRAPAALVPRRASAHLQAAHAEECAVSELNRQQWPCKISQG